MGSLEDHESQSSWVSTKRNMLSLKGVSDRKYIWSIMITSIKIAFFSDKINLLIPFGPLAMVVYKLTNQHVS